ncbi:MAG: hypothetical protein CL685_03615 [Candidatus Magasanikbacteria bacterium]|nr:hypothetical protein [Candidatus Magasanikbacteria bacterium]|tara:strand:- start:498 stop:1073 length:576 start_codon:yes stop_codon:yes gene_type:complete
MIVPTKIILAPAGAASPDGTLTEQGKKQVEGMVHRISQYYTSVSIIYHSGIAKTEESARIARGVFEKQIPVSIESGLCHEEVFEDFYKTYLCYKKDTTGFCGKTVQEVLSISPAMQAGRIELIDTIFSIARSIQQGSVALCFSHPFYLELAAVLDDKDPIFCGIKPGSAIVYSVMWNDIMSSKFIYGQHVI